MPQLPLDIPDLAPDLAPHRTYLTASERRVLATCTGTLLLATALIPGGGIGDLAVTVFPGDPPATRRWATVVRASTVVLFSWRLLREIARRDSVLPWVTIGKNCGCGRNEWCSHFRDATVAVTDRGAEDRDRTRIVVYDLVHELPVDSNGTVLSDAIAGRRRPQQTLPDTADQPAQQPLRRATTGSVRPLADDRLSMTGHSSSR